MRNRLRRAWRELSTSREDSDRAQQTVITVAMELGGMGVDYRHVGPIDPALLLILDATRAQPGPPTRHLHVAN